MKPVTVTAAVFNTELRSIVGDGNDGLSPDNHIRFFERLIENTKDADGQLLNLSEDIRDRLRGAIRPTEDLQLKNIRLALRDAGYVMSPEFETTITLLLSGAQFAAYLSETVNPETQKPWITMKKKRGAKKKALAALLGEAAPKAPAASEPAPEPPRDGTSASEHQPQPKA